VGHTSAQHHSCTFSSEDLNKLKSVVRRHAGTDFSESDLDDIAGGILIAAVVTASKPDAKASIAALAFTYAKKASYYATARRIAQTVAPKSPADYESADPRDPILAVEIADTLSSISPVNREMIWLCDTIGLTLVEAAETLGMSTATAHRRLGGARRDFRTAWVA
jgi:DNA-directed RNA polymerase specialized sigma24 family protein